MIQIRKVNPSWFSAVMGTGALSIAFHTYSPMASFLESISRVLSLIGILEYLVIGVLWGVKAIKYRKDALNELLNPSITHSYGMIGISTMLAASLFEFWGVDAATLWIIGATLTIIFSILVPHLLMISSKIEWSEVTPLWFIPPVGLIVIPMSGLPFFLAGELKNVVFFLMIFGLSSGLMLYIVMFSLFFGRALLHDPICCSSLPTLWINLGPLGVGSAALSKLSFWCPSLKEIAPISAILYFFGIWWLLILVLQTVHYKRYRRIPFGASWWAFIFPLGAYSIASYEICGIISETWPKFLGLGVLAASFLIWLYISVRYLILMVRNLKK